MTDSTAQLDTPPIAALKAAKKRCISMGAFHAWRPVFDMHPLAACMDNHTVCIDVELSEFLIRHNAEEAFETVSSLVLECYPDRLDMAFRWRFVTEVPRQYCLLFVVSTQFAAD